MLKKCKHDLSSQTRQHTEKVTKCKKNTKEKSEYVTVSKQFKTSEFQNGMFLKPSSDYRSRGGYSHTLPIRVCAAQRGRDFEAPDLERGIHFRGLF